MAIQRRTYLGALSVTLLVGGCLGGEADVDALTTPGDPAPLLAREVGAIDPEEPGRAIVFATIDELEDLLTTGGLATERADSVQAFIDTTDFAEQSLLYVEVPVPDARHGITVREFHSDADQIEVDLVTDEPDGNGERTVPDVAVAGRALIRVDHDRVEELTVRHEDADVPTYEIDDSLFVTRSDRRVMPLYLESRPDDALEEAFDDDWRDRWTQDGAHGVGTTETDRDHTLRVEYAEDSFYGTSLHTRFGERILIEPEAAHARYWIRHPEDWEFHPDGGTKLPGFAGVYQGTPREGGFGGRSSDGTNGWSARMFNRESRGDIGLGTQIYHADARGDYGDHPTWRGSLERGRWHAIDQYIQLNTPGEADGVYRGWIDGRPAIEETRLRFRDEDHEEIRIESFWINFYYGGGWGSPVDQYVDMTDVELWTWDRLPD